MKISSASISGRLTDDNRDFHFSHKIDDIGLLLLIDGASSCPNGGAFAQTVCAKLARCLPLLSKDDLLVETAGQTITILLQQIHEETKRGYGCDFASLILVVTHQEFDIAASLGDCLMGYFERGSAPVWMTPIHTYANAIANKSIDAIQHDANRHTLTRSYNGKRFIIPDITVFRKPTRSSLVLATDGFWAELNAAQQIQLLNGGAKPIVMDDCTFLSVSYE